MTAPISRVPAELLEECYQRLRTGETISACLERYPEYAAALGPRLQVIGLTRQAQLMPARIPVVAARARAQFFEAAIQMASSPVQVRRANRLELAWDQFLQGFSQVISSLRPIPAGLALTLSLVFLLGLLATGTVTASATALPGQFLYPVKLAAEQTRLRLAWDLTIHNAIAAQIDQNRLVEARQVLAQRLPVDQMDFAGVVESMQAGEWIISGVPVLITNQSRIDGAVQVGDHVRGTVRAPGNGTLVALKLSVDKPGEAGAAIPTPAPTATASAAVAAPPPTPTPSAIPLTLAPYLALPTISVSAGEVGLSHAPITEARPTTAPTTPTVTPQPTSTPAPSLTPLRTVTHGRIIDVVHDIKGSRWTIGTWVIDTNADTQYISSPGLGDRVDASVALLPDGSTLALSIKALRDSTGQRVDVTGIVNSMGPSSWNVDGTSFTIGGDTVIDGGIHVNDYVTVQAVRYGNGENHALRIIRLEQGVVQFSGPIDSMSGNHWVVMGKGVTIDSKTSITGGPAAVGRIADVDALALPGSLVARSIYIQMDTPTPTPAPPPPPKPTRTPAPPPPKPTRTPTPMPTRDVSALPHPDSDGGQG